MGEKRSIRTHGRSTTIRLELPFWRLLENIARAKGVSVSSLISRIDDDCRPSRKKEKLGKQNLASCLRVFCLLYLSEQNQLELKELMPDIYPTEKISTDSTDSPASKNQD